MPIRRRRSLLDSLKKQGRKRRREQKRDTNRLQLESLEDRRMLAGPELFAIRPDEAALMQQGDVLNVAPREFNLLFKGGADIDPNTIAMNWASTAAGRSREYSRRRWVRVRSSSGPRSGTSRSG